MTLMTRASAYSICSLLVLLAACGGGGGSAGSSGGNILPTAPAMPTSAPSATLSPSPAPSPTLATVTPSSIESGINTAFDDPDYYGTPTGTPKNKLFVMLPGTTSKPSNHQFLLLEGASRGYHVLGLMYVNGMTVHQYCAASTDPACFGNVRSEIIYGNGTSSLVSVSPADSIVGRLTALLTYLASSEPSSGWGQYLVNGAPAWSKIVVGGSSQGAGHALYLAKGNALAGACAFDSPEDGYSATEPATWLSQPNATSTSLLYGFTNQDDTIASYAGVIQAWSLIGIPGTPTDVDGGAPPYGGSHQIYTVASTSVTSSTHGYTSVDAVTPIVNGVPLFAPVWDTICFP